MRRKGEQERPLDDPDPSVEVEDGDESCLHAGDVSGEVESGSAEGGDSVEEGPVGREDGHGVAPALSHEQIPRIVHFEARRAAAGGDERKGGA